MASYIRSNPYVSINKDFKNNRRKFKEEYNNYWSQSRPSLFLRLRDYLRRKFIDRIYTLSVEDTLLDLGCGDSFFYHDVSPELSIGLDISFVVLKKAKSSDRNHFYVCGDSEALPFKDGSISKIVCIETLEHVLNPDKTLIEVKRILKKDGRILLSVPCENLLRGFLRKLLGWSENPFHINNYDINSARVLFSRFFTIKKILYFPSMLLPFEIIAILKINSCDVYV